MSESTFSGETTDHFQPRPGWKEWGIMVILIVVILGFGAGALFSERALYVRAAFGLLAAANAFILYRNAIFLRNGATRNLLLVVSEQGILVTNEYEESASPRNIDYFWSEIGALRYDGADLAASTTEGGPLFLARQVARYGEPGEMLDAIRQNWDGDLSVDGGNE